MNKENNFPKVFANQITKKIDNSQEFTTVDERKSKPLTKIELDKKISTIFKSEKYIYKINVEIITKKGKMEKTLIGKNNQGLITIDNEIINYDTIEDIYIK